MATLGRMMVPAFIDDKPLAFRCIVIDSEEHCFILGRDFMYSYRCSIVINPPRLELSYGGIPFA